MKFMKLAFALSAIALAGATAMAQDSTSVAQQPGRSNAADFRLAPVIGASSFANDTTVQTGFDQGFSAGVFADFGPSTWNFETGVLTLSSNASKDHSSASVNVNTWGVPLLAKMNFSGNPHETVFLKAGAMPFLASGQDINEFNVMAVGGVGGNIPLGKNSSILLDATYNRLFSQGGELTNYQGLALLGGLSFNL
jgi:hypothetical protein